MAKTDEGARQPLPPYISFKTLEGVVRKFKDTTVPDVVDTSVLRTYANSVGRQIIAAMKYLDPVNSVVVIVRPKAAPADSGAAK